MRKLAIAILLLALLLILPLLAMRSERSLLAIAHWGIQTFTDYRLELRDPVFRPLKGEVAAAEIHLFPKDDSAPPFLSLLGFSGDINARDIYTANLKHTTLHADQVILHVSDQDSTSDPAPMEWLRYLGWLPENLKIDQIHLITASETTFIFPLRNVVGSRSGANQYRASAAAQYDGEPLHIELMLSRVKEQGHFASIYGESTFTAPQSDSKIVLDGELRGTEEAFQYDASLVGNYTDIALFTRGFEGLSTLHGSLGITAKMQGDTKGFVLSQAHFTLDNMPAYGIEAAGNLHYSIGGDSTIELIASGDIESVGSVINWFDIDLTPLGRTQASAKITGSLSHPILDELILNSSKKNGLQVSIKGRFDPQAKADGTNNIAVDVAAPTLQTIEHWTGPLSYESGPWRASGTLHGNRDSISLSDLILEIGSPQAALLRLEGSVGNIAQIEKRGLRGVEAAVVKLSVTAQNSSQLGELLQTKLPPHFKVHGEVDMSGTGDELTISGGGISITSSDIEATVTPRSGSIQLAADSVLKHVQADINLTISDTSALSQFTELEVPALGPVTAKGKLAQTPDSFALRDILIQVDTETLHIESTGQIQNLANLSSMTANTRFSGLDSKHLLQILIKDFQYAGELSPLKGSFILGKSGKQWDVTKLRVDTSDRDGALEFSASASITDIIGEPLTDVAATFAVRDSQLLESLSGWPLSPGGGSLTMTSAPGIVNLAAKTRLGETMFNAHGTLEHMQRRVTGLTLNIDSPHIYLADLGLQAQSNSDDSKHYKPADQLEDIEKTKFLESLMQRSPRFSSDVKLNVADISGENTNIQRLNIHFTGLEKRYTFREFSIGYAKSQAELRGIIDLNPSPPFISLAGEALSLPLNTLSRDLGIKSDIAGTVTVRGGITSSGTKADALLQTLNGSVAVALENAVIEGAAYDVLATDFLAWIYSGAALEKSTHIDCTMANFQLTDGVAKTDSLYIETARMVATGKAKVDLPTQQLDIEITPWSKSRTLQVPSAVRLKGDFSKPRATVSPISAAADTTAQILTLLPTMAMKIFGIKGNQKEQRPCVARN